MKKLFVFVVLAVFAMSFTKRDPIVVEPPIPASWKCTFKWDPTNCNCGTIIVKKIVYFIYNTSDECWVQPTTDPITVTGTEYQASGSGACMAVDCENCYNVQATVYYYDSSGLCCSATASTTWSGSELNNETAELLIEM